MNVRDKHPDTRNSDKNLKYKIIVIEDDDGLNRLIQKKLQKEGYETVGAMTGIEALLKTSGAENEILLIDYKLPDMTGKQLTKQIIKKYNSVPSIIVITGYGDEKIAIEMMKLGVWDYMVKEPDFIEILPEKIKHICADIEKNKKLKKAEEDLHKSVELLNETGEMARVGGWELDLDKKTVYWTQSTKKIHEVAEDYIPTLEEAINFFPGESKKRMENALKKAIQEGIEYDMELQFVSAKNNKLWVHAVGRPEIKDGKCVRLHGTFQDITPRIVVENELKINHDVLRRTQKIAKVASWEWDIETDKVTWSDELFHFFKMDPQKEAPSFADHPELFTDESMERLNIAVKNAVDKGQSYELDLEFIRKNGVQGFCTARGFGKKDKKGKVIQLFGSFQDITERKKAEKQLLTLNQNLEESEHKYRTTVESISDGLLVLKSDKLIVSYFNKAAEDLLGRKAEDVLNKPLFDAFPEAKGSEFENKYKEAFKKKKFISFEIFFGIEPYTNWYDVKVYPGKDSISVFFQVITKRKQLELALQETSEFLNETEKTGKIGGWQFDPKTLKQTWTDEVFRILEIDLENEAPEVPKGLEFIDPEFRPMAEKAIQRAMELGEPYNMEWMVTTAKGNKKWVNAVCSPKMKNGKVITISGSFQDITSRKITEEELKKSEERIRLVIDNSPFPVAVVDEKDQNILYWSKSALELFGHDPKTSEEWYQLAYPDPEYRSEVIERWKPFLETARKSPVAVNTGEYEIHCKSGEVKICEIHAQFIPGSLLITLNDITERKKAEEQLKAMNQQLAASEQQLKASNQQLQANEQQLKASLQQLQANEQQLQATVQQLQANEEQLKSANQELAASEEQLTVANQQLLANEQQLRAANQQLTAGEKELRDSKEEAERYLNVAAEIILSLDSNGTITMLNDSGYQLLGYDKGELIGKEWFSTCIPEKDEETIRKVFGKIMKGKLENVSNYESRIITKSGQIKTLLWHNTLLKDKDGKITGTLSSGEDITESAEAKEKLAASEYKYRSIMDNSSSVIFIKDLEGKYVYVNKKFEEEHKITNDEIQVLTDFDLFPEDQAKQFRENDLKVIKSGKPENMEELVSVGNEIRTVLSTKFPLKDKNEKVYALCGIATDITDRKKAGEELIKAKEEIEIKEERFRKSQEAGHIGSWEYNLQTGEFWGSDEGKRIYNLDLNKKEFPAEEVMQLVAEKDREKVNQAMVDLVNENKPYDIIFEITPKNTSEKKLIHSIAELQKDNEGNPLKVTGLLIDVTLQKTMEKQLIEAKEMAEEKEAIIQAAMDNSHAGIAIADVPDGKLRYVNKAGLMVRDKDYKDIVEDVDINKYVSSWQILYLDGTPYEPENVPLARAVLKGESVREEFIVRRDNNEDRYVLAHAAPINNEKGERIAAIVVFLDITERKLAEFALQKNKDLLNETGHMAKVGGWEIDLFGNTLAWTEETYHIHELSPESQPNVAEAINFYHPDDREMVTSAVEKAIKNSQPFDFEARLITKKGNQIWVRSSGKPVTKEGKFVGIRGSIQDISDRKQVEMDLIEAKEKAEEADRLKSAFLANMSHEIRTPMNGILGFTSLLQEPGLSGEEQQKFIKIIQESGDRMLNTVNDLIDISKIETGQAEVYKENVNICEQIRNFRNFFMEEASRKNIQITLENSLAKNEEVIETDTSKFSSIFTNLIKNAIKFTDEGFIRIGCQRKGKHILFYVKDSGIGIPEYKQEAIFERFVQADMGDTRSYEGSGLGLAITKAYVEMLGGRIWLESAEKEGSAFYFTLPYASVDSNENQNDANDKKLKMEEKQKGKITILIAEDDDSSYEYLSMVLRPVANSIIRTETGTETIRVIKNNQNIDIILMDIKMPVMDGYEATKKIREFNKDVIILAQTAYALEGDQEKALEVGCNGYISKPINKKNLLLEIAKYTGI